MQFWRPICKGKLLHWILGVRVLIQSYRIVPYFDNPIPHLVHGVERERFPCHLFPLVHVLCCAEAPLPAPIVPDPQSSGHNEWEANTETDTECDANGS